MNVYVGPLSGGDDPLDWGGDDKTARLPAKISSFFPHSRKSEFFALKSKIDAGLLRGKKLDWGAFAAIATKQQILNFVDELYHDDPTYSDPNYMPHLYPKLRELRDVLNDLSDGDYALVGVEL